MDNFLLVFMLLINISLVATVVGMSSGMKTPSSNVLSSSLLTMADILSEENDLDLAMV